MSALLNGMPVSLESLWVNQVQSTSSTAVLALHLYDWFLTFSDEQRYIWSDWKLNIYIKAMFLALRYVALGSQLVLYIWDSQFLPSYPVSESACGRYHTLEVYALMILLIVVDCFFILRAWLLSNRRTAALTFLIAIFICQLYIIITLNLKILPHLNMDSLCMPNPPASKYILSWLSGLIVHTSSWAYAMYQCWRYRKQQCGNTPLVSLMERDASCCWVSIIATVAIGMICTYRISTAMSHIIVPWILTEYSILGCRMIINIQHLADSDKDEYPDSESIWVELTTNPRFYD